MQQVRRVLGGRVHADGEDDHADGRLQQQGRVALMSSGPTKAYFFG